MICRFALAQVKCTRQCLFSKCKQSITSMSLVVGRTVESGLYYKCWFHKTYVIKIGHRNKASIIYLSLFCFVLLCVHSKFAIILKRKRKMVDLLLLSNRCIVIIIVLWLFLTVPWVCLQCVIVVFPDHTDLLFA